MVKLWETPIYKFRIPKNEEDTESSEFKEIIIDVTGSAPPFKEPSDGLKEVLREIFKSDSFQNITNVLEFGAAKLKNIPFILKQGKTVCAVEFKELSENAFTKENIKKCETYGIKFQKLIFPNPFLSKNQKFDLALLLNVIPVMPVFAERLYLLNLLYEKIQDGKYLLWVAQKEGSYKKIREEGKNFCGDGLWMGKNRSYKTFFKYHKIEELDEFMALYGFKLIKKFSIGDDARLYQKTKHNLFSDIITPERILEFFPDDAGIDDPKTPKINIIKKTSKTKPRIPNPKPLSIESLYKEKIQSLDIGKYPEQYHRIVSHAMSRIFRGSLRNMEIKVEIDEGIKIIDTIFTNSSDQGFFHNLKSKFECIHPIIEVKDIEDDPTNPDFDQLNGRLNKNHGHFGILICRQVSNVESVYKRCKTALPDNGILFLTQADIFELLEYSRENNCEEINDFMDKKLRNLLF